MLLAGPAFNFLFAILAYWLMFVTGVQALKPFIGGVEPDSVAARAGLEPGDEIEAIGGQTDADVGERDAARFSTSCSMTAASSSRYASRTAQRATCTLDVRGREQELTEPAVLFQGLGITPGPAAVVGSMVDGSPAERAGLEPDDVVIRGNGEPIRGLAALGRVPAEPAR